MMLLSGGSGALARLAADRLDGRDDVAVGTRTPHALDTALPARRFDLDDPSTLPAALAGVDTLVLVSAGYAEDDVVLARHGAAIDAAVLAGVRHVVYTSLYAAGSGASIAVAHRWTERALAAAPLDATVLRNALYPEVPAGLAAGAAPSPDPSVFTAPWGSGRVSLATRGDLADALAIVATEVDGDVAAGRRSLHAGRTYELAHPEPVDGPTVAAHLSAAAGSEVRYEATPLGAAREALTAAGGAGFGTAHGMSILGNLVAGALVQPRTDLPTLLRRPATDVLPELVAVLGHPATRAANPA
jgi:NAD(P)H dehydrogenase (quinone)